MKKGDPADGQEFQSTALSSCLFSPSVQSPSLSPNYTPPDTPFVLCDLSSTSAGIGNARGACIKNGTTLLHKGRGDLQLDRLSDMTLDHSYLESNSCTWTAIALACIGMHPEKRRRSRKQGAQATRRNARGDCFGQGRY